METAKKIALINIREEAISWGEHLGGGNNSQSSYGCNATRADMRTLQPVYKTPQSPELLAITDLVKQQQTQITILSEQLQLLQVTFNQSQAKWTKERKCLQCNKPGHIARYCRQPMPTDMRPKLKPTVQTA